MRERTIINDNKLNRLRSLPKRERCKRNTRCMFLFTHTRHLVDSANPNVAENTSSERDNSQAGSHGLVDTMSRCPDRKPPESRIA